MSAIEFEVRGTPAPKGSNRAMVRGGRAVFVPGGSKVNQAALKGWDACVRADALEKLGPLDGPVFVGVPLAVSITFRLARPAGHWSRRGLKVGLRVGAPAFPAVKPDADKLARSTLDSLSGLVFDDDARIVRLIVAKEYAQPGREGAAISVWECKQ
ncbi:MAG: RusA family crossover junction endodeoxyribonuclease [Polyangiaceae bacterium]|nr:RusA family crossover junction endodeoxyribonuclease [Polyangiaceae bacterium]